MKKIFLDKIGSVTKNCQISKEVTVSKDIDCKEGDVLAVQALEQKHIYNTLELPSGRMAKIQKEDIMAVTLGNRRALKGFVGSVPKKLNTGDKVQILNLGGVAGSIESENLHLVGKALNCKVLGQVVLDNKKLNIGDFAKFKPKEKVESNPKLIIVSGTCMNAGKTTVSCEIIKHLRRNNYTVAGAKLAGIAAIRDVENMKDHGAFTAVSMIDGGLTSTVNSEESANLAKAAVDFLAEKNPDFIVIEFGDGVLGEYGVLEIISDPEISKITKLHIGVAHDPVGAIGLFDICQSIKNPLHIFSGPVTDNEVGSDFIRKKISIPAENALHGGDALWREANKILNL